MRHRLHTALLITLAVAACDAPDTSSTEASSGQVPLRYRVFINGLSYSGPLKMTANEAYTDALAQLETRCSASLKPKHECLGKAEVFLTPVVWLPNAPHPIDEFGYVATFTRYIEGVASVRAMFTTRSDARAVDYRWSMSNMQNMLTDFRFRAKRALEDRDELVKEARDLTKKFTAAGEAVYGVEHANLLRKQQLIRESQAVIERYRSAIADRQAEYEALATEYKAFHNAEPTAVLQQLATNASTAELPAFPALQQQLIALVNAENGPPQDLTVRADRLDGYFDGYQHQFNIEIQPYRAFLDEEGIIAPDLTTRPREILGGMQRYLADRQQRMNVAAEKLFAGMQRRKSALLLLQRDAQTRVTIADASRARAAADFLTQATVQIQATWAAAPVVGAFELLGARYQGVLALLQAGTMCNDPDVADWMSDGCGAYAINVSKANLYLATTLPRKLRRNAILLRNAGAVGAQVDALDAAVNANDLAKAVALHDTLVHEVTP
jgi:hypothetical protein